MNLYLNRKKLSYLSNYHRYHRYLVTSAKYWKEKNSIKIEESMVNIYDIPPSFKVRGQEE